MTEDELIQFLRAEGRGEDSISDIAKLHDTDWVKAKALADGRALSDPEAEEIAAKRRKQFADSLRTLEDGSAHGLDMLRPIKYPYS